MNDDEFISIHVSMPYIWESAVGSRQLAVGSKQYAKT
jgi:hypothetical protein